MAFVADSGVKEWELTEENYYAKTYQARGSFELLVVYGNSSSAAPEKNKKALISKNTESHMVSSCNSLILQLSEFLPFCGFTYYDLLTSFDFGTIAGEQPEVDGDDFLSCFSFSMDGASLAVIWGHISEEVAKAAGEHAMATLNKIRDDRHGRWKALGSLKSILPSVDYLWVVKSHSIDLILSMTDETNPVESDEVPIDFLSLMPSIFAVLKGIQRTMIGAPDASLRKKAFLALKKAWFEDYKHFTFYYYHMLVVRTLYA